MLILKYKDIYKDVNINAGVKGRFKLTAIRPDGSVRHLTDWFDNLILDSGLNSKFSSTYTMVQQCVVGTGTSTPVTTQTSLDNQVMSTTTKFSNSYTAQGSAPYYGKNTTVFRFAAAASNYNLTEVGIKDSTSGTPLMFSRALILDGSGNPTTVTILTGEVLDVSYELRMYPGSAYGDYTQSGIDIDGVSTTIVSRASVVGDSYWGRNAVGGLGDIYDWGLYGTVYSGTIGAVTSSPSGSSYSASGTLDSYSTGSFNRTVRFTYGLTNGNYTGGIQSVKVESVLGYYQYSFSPAIAKDSTKTLTLAFNLSLSRI